MPYTFNSLAACNKFCHLVMDPDQDRHHAGPDLDPSCLTLMIFRNFRFQKSFLGKNIFEADNKKGSKTTQHAKSS